LIFQVLYSLSYCLEFITNILDPITFIIELAHGLLSGIVNLKKLVRTAINLNPSTVVNDTFEKMIKEICIIVGSDRASVFLLDNKKGVLWTKGAVGS
jgi:hypothetical protein